MMCWLDCQVDKLLGDVGEGVGGGVKWRIRPEMFFVRTLAFLEISSLFPRVVSSMLPFALPNLTHHTS